ncbi:hypothetical protein AGABI1DRAFT_85789, partial [Agaricus bisporus var. burnettii JB137-S8]
VYSLWLESLARLISAFQWGLRYDEVCAEMLEMHTDEIQMVECRIALTAQDLLGSV